MYARPAPKNAELRLALGMRGGVSLAVWIGGACAEIDELRRAGGETDDPAFWAKLLEASNYERVVVDVMAGASAGGLNGVLFAAAIRNGFRWVTSSTCGSRSPRSRSSSASKHRGSRCSTATGSSST